jgi:phosphoglycerate dehydrogenase-like enzyme
MASNALLLLVGVPENYRLGGPAFQRLHQAHPRVQVRIVHDQVEFARQVTQADAVIGSRPYLKLSAAVAGARLRWVQTTTAGVDQAVPPDLLAAEHVTVTCIKGPPGPLMAEHAVLLMLALSRNLPAYLKNQQLHIWRREGQDWLPLHGQTIAILGVGSGGGNLARVCKTGFGMTVLGMTRTPREIPHVDRAFGQSGLLSVLPEADFVVLCLPHTPETRHIISGAKTCVDLRRTSRCWEWWTGGRATETTGTHTIFRPPRNCVRLLQPRSLGAVTLHAFACVTMANGRIRFDSESPLL